MNKKGFTLVEVLAVILILGLLVTIVYPIVVETINSSKEKAYNSEIEIIKKAAKVYALDKESEGANSSVLPNLRDDAQPKYVLISVLISEGYIADEELQNNELLKDGELIHPKDQNKTCDRVKIFYGSNQYNYIVVNIADEECSAIH